MGQTSHKALKKDLIGYYREREFTMPVAPLVEQHEAELTKFYVRPPIMAYNKPNAFGQKKQTKEEKNTKIHSYRELLLNGNDPYRCIYVTADAGMGKTSFAKMLVVTWCESHAPRKQPIKKLFTKQNMSPDRNDAVSFNTDDLDATRNFDFLFLIKLREFESSAVCSLDEMILEMLKSKLPHRVQYTNEFLENILCNNQCLIIVDGLDEWIHPQSCRRGEVIPHRRQWPRCSVLTTTRPWKLSTARLAKSDIDRHVELAELDETTARKLESHAVELLNENQRQNKNMVAKSNPKTVTDFETSVPVKLIPEIRYIPFVLLQMICLWFENCLIGRSLCEVYSNIIELTLTRWLVKTDDSRHEICKCKPSEEYENIEIKCMRNNTHCRCYMPLLSKIGELAFSTLLGVIPEKSLLFDMKRVLKYLDNVELNQCLYMGLLSQVKDATSVSQVRMQYYFPHKTFHEFFCALFIATNWSVQETTKVFIKETITNKCRSVSNILDMSKVFVFVCGLNPDVYSDISRHLASIVDQDQSVVNYRNCVDWNPPSVYDASMTCGDYQSMQISCFLESARNDHPECKIVLEDIVLGCLVKNGELPVKILSNNTSNMRSLLTVKSFSERDILTDTDQILEESECSCLETLTLLSSSTLREIPFLPNVLTTAAHTLKYLNLHRVTVTADIASAISSLNNLQSLHLSEAVVTADRLNGISECIRRCVSLQKLYLKFGKSSMFEIANIENLLKAIEKKTILTHLELDNCFVVDQEYNAYCHSYVLDLSQHSKLQQLELSFPLSELHINPDHLVMCEIRNMGTFSVHAVSSLLAELHGAPVLKTFGLIHIPNPFSREIISVLPLATEFTPKECDFRETTITLTLPQVTMFTLEHCDLRESTLTLTLPQVTKFTLEHCDLRGSTVTLTLPQPKVTKSILEQCDLRESTVTLTLTQVTKFVLENCDLRGSTATLILPKAIKFTLENCDLRDSNLTISPEMTSLKTIKLKSTTLNILCCRELFLSISKLPQPITVELESVSLTAEEWKELFLSLSKLQQPITVKLEFISMNEGEWRKLLFDILGNLPKSIHVDMSFCLGPSKEEWKCIVDCVKTSQAFSFHSADVNNILNVYADIRFDTVGVGRMPLLV